MSTVVIDGKALAAAVKSRIAVRIAEKNHKPHLAVILVGDDEASLVYDRSKQKAAKAVGMECDIFHLEEKTSEDELLALIEHLNQDENIHGILVQLPLPAQINPEKIIGAILPQKDVDGFNPYNAGLLQSGSDKAVVAATPKGILHILHSVYPSLKGMHAVIIGRSNIVGRPLASLLLNHDCTVTVAHSKTANLPELCATADILVAACGCPKLVKRNWVKPGAAVIDVGINRIEGKLCGDVDFDDVCGQVDFITPVPGGVGPMTIAMLLENTYQAYLNQIEHS